MKMPEPKDWMRGTLAVACLVSFMVALFWLLNTTVPQQNEQLVTFMLGQLSIFTGGALGFYFYTSKSSADKNDMLEHLQRPDRDWSTPTPVSPAPPVDPGEKREYIRYPDEDGAEPEGGAKG